jgi:hypothetical protein
MILRRVARDYFLEESQAAAHVERLGRAVARGRESRGLLLGVRRRIVARAVAGRPLGPAGRICRDAGRWKRSLTRGSPASAASRSAPSPNSTSLPSTRTWCWWGPL